jgi:hypothetical protein
MLMISSYFTRSIYLVCFTRVSFSRILQRSENQLHSHKYLDKLLESAVDRRADVRNVLVELNGRNSTLANALWGELKLL